MLVAYIKRVTLCFVTPLMKTTAWLSKRLAIINQFWLVKSGNRFNMSTPSHKGFFSREGHVGVGRVNMSEWEGRRECQVPPPLSPLPPAVVMVLLHRVPVRRSSPPLPWPRQSRCTRTPAGSCTLHEDHLDPHHPRPTLPPHIHNSISCGVRMFVCKQPILALESFAPPVCT